MADRKMRDSNITKKELMVPFDVTQFGSEDDPCFGKLWDPKNSTCQSCGDIEICGIAFSKNTRKVEADLETKHEFLDKRDFDIASKKIKAFIEKRRDLDYDDDRLLKLVILRFNITKDKAKQFLKQK
jgi:hypothetical protein